jgi:hypothetical protein
MPREPARRCRRAVGFAGLACLFGGPAVPDEPNVDKVYPPYVEPLEREFEYRSIVQQDRREGLDGVQIHRLSFGWSWAERWASELYLIGGRNKGEDLVVDAVEFETLWQITEQGEHWADWGLLFEFERERGVDIWEYQTRLLISREWGRWVTTANLGLVYEWGDDIDNEWESILSVQARYRLAPHFEPAIELYSGEQTKGLGPILLGEWRTGAGSRLRWQFGVILGVDDASPDQTWRAQLEYEFQQ